HEYIAYDPAYPLPAFLRARCKISSLAGGRERGRPAGRGAVCRDQCFSGEHPVGLFADRTRLELIFQRTLHLSRTIGRWKIAAGRVLKLQVVPPETATQIWAVQSPCCAKTRPRRDHSATKRFRHLAASLGRPGTQSKAADAQSRIARVLHRASLSGMLGLGLAASCFVQGCRPRERCRLQTVSKARDDSGGLAGIGDARHRCFLVTSLDQKSRAISKLESSANLVKSRPRNQPSIAAADAR